MLTALKQARILLHPMVIFIIAQISWALLMIVWIRWYISRTTEFEALLEKFGPHPSLRTGQWIVLLEGCILMGILLVALYVVFVNLRRQVRLNQMQDSILSSVTHELKTPIASIRLYLETLELRELSQTERQHFIQRSLQELSRLQSLVDRVLLSAQLRATFKKPKHERLDLKEILIGSWQKMTERVGDKRECQLVGFDECSTIPILGIRADLQILFDNLLDNAVKYTKTGGKIWLKVFPAGPSKIEIVVTDNGIGIEKGQLKRVFQRFFRAEGASKRHVTGSGLGLSLAHAIVKTHNGTLIARSPGPEKGASFHVTFKREDSSR